MVDTFIKYLNGRAKTQLYGVFIFWLLLFHIDLIFAAVFVDQELVYKATSQLKDQYIQAHYLQFREWEFWSKEVIKLLTAGLFTFLMIWILPKTIVAWAYSKELDADYGRRQMKLTKDKGLEKQKQILSGEKIRTVKKEEEVLDKQEDLENKESSAWLEDYRRLDQNELASTLEDISQSIVRHTGRIKKYYDDEEGWMNPGISHDSIMLAYSNGLIDMDKENERMTLTPKGKFFISLTYQKENK